MVSDERNGLEDDGQPNGRYANHFKVGHNAFEFLLDFGQCYAQSNPAPAHTRIVTTPVYAKTFLGLLKESIDRYERIFGTIPKGDNPNDDK